jgi:pyridoxal phosphate enzyme (YggS family)
MTDEYRRTELVASLGAVRNRISQACEAAGRDTSSVTLIAVTKTYPATDVLTLAQLGVLDVGESKNQEAKAKIAEIRSVRPKPALRWHLLGRLQTNKARSVASYAHAVHSVDRPKLVTALADACADAAALGERTVPLQVFVQVSLDGDPERGGVSREGVAALADAVAGRPELSLRGVMAVAPLGVDPDAAFEDLAAVAARLRQQHPQADALSAGMSHDLDAAIRHGATHLRIGTALLGQRPPLIS